MSRGDIESGTIKEYSSKINNMASDIDLKLDKPSQGVLSNILREYEEELYPLICGFRNRQTEMEQ